MLSPKHTIGMWRDQIVSFLLVTLKYPPNARRFINSGGVPVLLHYISEMHAVQDEEEKPKQAVSPAHHLHVGPHALALHPCTRVDVRVAEKNERDRRTRCIRVRSVS